MENLEESLLHLEQALGLPEGFFLNFKEEDDWSFVIKLHALFECAVAEQLTGAFGLQELNNVFPWIAMGDFREGKLAFIKALNLLPDGHVQFLRELGKLRNDFAHKVQNVTLTLVDYFKNTTANHKPKELQKFADRWAFGLRVEGEEYTTDPLARFSLNLKPPSEIPMEVTCNRASVLCGKPKEFIWFTARAVLDAISLCNRYGPQTWDFSIECEDRKDCEDFIHEVFEKAKIGDSKLPERMAQKFAHLHPGVRIRHDVDGQPDLVSMAAAFAEHSRIETEHLLQRFLDEP